MMMTTARAAYMDASVATASPARLLIMLFDRLVLDVQRGLAVGDLIKWFEPVGDNWRASPELRRMIDFRTDNLFDAKAPSGEYDLLLCRNVLLYFTQERRQHVFRLLTRHSNDKSVLLLGAGETVIGHSDDFIPHPEFRGAYARRADRSGSEPLRRAGRFSQLTV